VGGCCHVNHSTPETVRASLGGNFRGRDNREMADSSKSQEVWAVSSRGFLGRTSLGGGGVSGQVLWGNSYPPDAFEEQRIWIQRTGKIQWTFGKS